MKSTYLRQNLFKILDSVASTGIPVEIDRKGTKLKIVSSSPQNKLSNLKERKYKLRENPKAFTHIDWTHEWKFSK